MVQRGPEAPPNNTLQQTATGLGRLAEEDMAMRSDRRTVLVGAAVVGLAVLGIRSSASPGRGLTPDDEDEKTSKRKNVLIIGASSLISPLGQPRLVGALSRARGRR